MAELSRVNYKDIKLQDDLTIVSIYDLNRRLSAPTRTSGWHYMSQLFRIISEEYKFKILLAGEGADEIQDTVVDSAFSLLKAHTRVQNIFQKY